MLHERSGRSARPEGRGRKQCKRSSAQLSIVSEVLRQGFRLANHRPRLIFLDLAWKSIWLVLTLAGLFLVAIWFGAELRALVWADTGNRAVNGAIAVALLRRFWLAKHAAIFAAVSAVLFLSLVAWFLLDAGVRARISESKPLPMGEADARSAAGEGHKSIQILRPSPCPLPGGEDGSAKFGRWNSLFRIFLISNVLKSLLIALAVLALAAICFGRYFVTPFSEWPQLWPDTRGAFFITVVTIATLGFFLTILDTLVRNDAIELLGTDLFRVT